MRPGRLEVIAGCMFAGKTTELIRRLDAARQAGLRVMAFKHRLDARYHAVELATHDGGTFPAIAVGGILDLPGPAAPCNVIGIDEGQFFGDGLADACRAWTGAGVRVIVSGIDYNIRGRPFSPFPLLKAMAAEVLILHTPCDCCGGPGRYSQRVAPIVNGNMVGGRAEYSPRCERCFEPWTAEIPA